MAKKLYVGNLPYSVNEESLRQMFTEFGEVTSATIISDRMTGRPKGFGFVEFADDAAADAATAALNGKDMEGRAIVVNEARPQEDRGNRGGFGGGHDRRY